MRQKFFMIKHNLAKISSHKEILPAEFLADEELRKPSTIVVKPQIQ